jgi:diguanylate cyclase (GGDEF)-like protein/PAS domain S-box-containing protein
MDDSVNSRVDFASELERLRTRLASRQTSEAREAWARAEAALADLPDPEPSGRAGPEEPTGPPAADVRFEQAPVGLLEIDASGTVVACNRACARLFADAGGTLVGRASEELLVPDDVPALRDGLGALDGKPEASTHRQDVTGQRADGTRICLSLAAAALRDARGRVDGFVVSIDDRSERRQIEVALRAANERLTSWVADLEQRSREHGLVSETGDLLQACRTAEEAYGVIARMGRRLFPGESGSVAVAGGLDGLVEVVSSWGTPPGDRTFGHEACWALRRGRPHLVQGSDPGPQCRHMPATQGVAYLCVPMMAYGEAVGLLTLSLPASEAVSEPQRRLATTVAEHIALALANLKLQESLRRQSIRDPLTGLFNRRYMEESLEREMRRAGRARHPVGVIMLDLDHFKPFNDTHGHEVGDALLREVGAVLQRSIRGEDIACRYGGEEFILILPEASLRDAAQRAQQIRDAIRAISMVHDTRPVGPVTVSLGVAIFPEDGRSAVSVLRAADAALYRAKAEGRNRVETTRSH